MTNYKLMLLARAEKGGVPVHEGLREPCDDGRHMAKDPIRPVMWYGDCEDFNCPGYTPNPAPMALIAACHFQRWEPKFRVYEVLLHRKWMGHGPSNLAALTDVLFQATETLAPDNWMACPGNEKFTCGVPIRGNCNACTSTGIVIKEGGSDD